MAPISVESFPSRIRDLSADQFVAFVADLWTARGYEYQIDRIRYLLPETVNNNELSVT